MSTILHTFNAAHSRALRDAAWRRLLRVRSGNLVLNKDPLDSRFLGNERRVLRLLFLSLLAFCFSVLAPAHAQIREGDYLYKVSTIRAGVGEFESLLEWIAQVKASDYFKDAGAHPPFVMRHSQGDQWDLLLITPMESWTKYYSKSLSKKRNKAAKKHVNLLSPADALIAFDVDHFAYGPPLDELTREYSENGFFHIEMFHAAPGKAAALLKQRQMENVYLSATGQTTNMIFVRAGGSDVDIFTIGFHETLQSFAAPSGASSEEAEAAAVAAGFKNRGDISFYLRALISAHHDTLAVKVE